MRALDPTTPTLQNSIASLSPRRQFGTANGTGTRTGGVKTPP
ncbi:MAG: hypothetical protein U1E65_23955 [Myxococcota bacterium]